MNCDEFKRFVMSQPGLVDDSVKAHKQDCPGCSEFIQEVGVFEVQMLDALQVPVPPDLKEEFVSGTLRHSNNKRLKKVSYALAASVCLMVGAAFLVNLNIPPRIESLVIAHIEKEPFTLTKNMNPSVEYINETLSTLGIAMNQEIGKVRFIKRCYVGDELVAHFVVDGKQGPITILVMPHESLLEQRFVESRQLQGMVVPNGAHGSIAIIGYIGEPIKELAAKAQGAFTIKS